MLLCAAYDHLHLHPQIIRSEPECHLNTVSRAAVSDFFFREHHLL